MKKEFRFLYTFLMIVVLAITTIGATYAYWTASTQSASSEVKTESTIYSISMDISPLYHDFSVIPMNDWDALKALKNQCKDKYDRGACSAYTIDVYDYNESLGFISGYMDVITTNMQNLSYMVLRISDTFEEGKCVLIEKTSETYCIGKEATHMGDGVGLSLGDTYSVEGISSTKFILLIWLSNLSLSQNDIDIGSFNAIVTMQAGNGGKIKGSISSVIEIEDEVVDPDNPDNGTNDKVDDSTDTGGDIE